MHRLVSVIICTYNRKELVPRAIESALAQEEVDIEITVVDDCSTDGTYEYLQNRYGDRIKVAKTETNSGVSTATNLGYRHSSGKYIALLGDDDYWEDPLKIAKQLKVMENEPHVGVTGTWWIELQGGERRVRKTPVRPKSRYFLKERMLMGGGVVCGSTPLITREAWESVGGMDYKQKKGTDSDLFRRITLAGYDVNILHEVTTVVDVGHALERMTPVTDINSKRRHLHGHLQVLSKHFFVYLIYPRSLVRRLRSVLRALFSLSYSKCRKFLIG